MTAKNKMKVRVKVKTGDHFAIDDVPRVTSW